MIANHIDLDDIEDIVKPGDLTPNDRYNNKKQVTVRARKIKVGNGDEVKENGLHESVSNIKSLKVTLKVIILL